MSGGAPLHFVASLPAEEQARANFYGLLARLFQGPPDAALLETLAAVEEIEAEDGALSLAWRNLARAAAATDPEAVREEYETAFIGTGKAPITLYVCAYSIRYSNEVPLAQLRATLAALGIARRNEVNEPEDHVAALCEVMRFLIAERKAGLEVQKRFFETWLWPSVEPLCAAIGKSGQTSFYKSAAGFLLRLCTIEHAAFEML